MESAVKTLVFLSLLCPAFGYAGGFYMCKDAAGRTLTSDRPIPECADRTLREYGSNGVLKREIAPPLTPEQKRQQAMQRQQRQDEQMAAQEQRRADRALLARYQNEDDIGIARARASAALNEQIGQQKQDVTAAEAEWKSAQDAIEARGERTIPAGMRDKLAIALENLRINRMTLQESELGLARINEKYDAVLQRYRELSGQPLPAQSAAR